MPMILELDVKVKTARGTTKRIDVFVRCRDEITELHEVEFAVGTENLDRAIQSFAEEEVVDWTLLSWKDGNVNHV